jgi:zinc protease
MKYAMALIVLSTLAAQTRSRPPDTPPVPDYRLPNVFETRLDNGLAVVLVEDNRFPLVSVRLGFLAGSKFDPAEIPGLSESVGAMLTEGSAKRTSRQIAEELAAIGGELNAVTSPDALTLAGSALSENAPRLLDLLADVARNAAFPENEVALHKQNRKQTLLEQRSDPGYLAEEEAAKDVFGAHPYAHRP